MEPVIKTWDNEEPTRVIPQKNMEYNRGSSRGKPLYTVKYKTKKGRYVLKNGELVPTFWSKVRKVIMESIHS